MKKTIKLLMCCLFLCLSFIPINAESEKNETTPIQVEANNNKAEVSFTIPENGEEVSISTDITAVDSRLEIKQIGTLITQLEKNPFQKDKYQLSFTFKKNPKYIKEWYAIGYNVRVRASNLINPKTYAQFSMYKKTNPLDPNVFLLSDSFKGKSGERITLNFTKAFIDFYKDGRLYKSDFSQYGFKM